MHHVLCLIGDFALIGLGYFNKLIYIITIIFLIFTIKKFLINILSNFIFFKESQDNNLINNQEMSLKEARKILNLDANASKKEIIQAYYKLIKKNHPDRGGLEHMAKKIICAKNILMKSKKDA